MCSHVGHVKDLPQGLITAIIHLHHVSCGEAVLVPLLGCLRRQMVKKKPHKMKMNFSQFIYAYALAVCHLGL